MAAGAALKRSRGRASSRSRRSSSTRFARRHPEEGPPAPDGAAAQVQGRPAQADRRRAPRALRDPPQGRPRAARPRGRGAAAVARPAELLQRASSTASRAARAFDVAVDVVRERLVRRARRGGVGLGADLRRAGAAGRGYLRAHGAAEPEDLAGEVFLQVVRGLDRFSGAERDFRAWVFTIAHRRLVDDAPPRRAGRRRRRRPRRSPSRGRGRRRGRGGDRAARRRARPGRDRRAAARPAGACCCCGSSAT